MRRGIFWLILIIGVTMALAAYQQLSVPSLQEAQRTQKVIETQQRVAQESGASNSPQGASSPERRSSSVLGGDAKILNLRIEIEDKKLAIDQKIQEMADLQQVRESLSTQRETQIESQSQNASQAFQNALTQERQLAEQYGARLQQEMSREVDARTQLESNINQLKSSLQTQANEIRIFPQNNPTLSQSEMQVMLDSMRSRYQNDQSQLTLYQQELERLASQTRVRLQELETAKQVDLSNIHLQKQSIQAELQSLNERDRRLDEREFQTRIQGPEIRYLELQNEIQQDRQSLRRMEGELQNLQQGTTITE